MQVLMGLILLLARIWLTSHSSHYLFEWFFDFSLLILLISLGAELDLGALWRSWVLLRQKKTLRHQINFISGLISNLIRVLAFFFFGAWIYRWFKLDWYLGESSFSPYYVTYLDTFFLCLFLAEGTSTGRWRLWLSRISWTPNRQLLVQFLAAIFVGTILLVLPISINPHQSLSLLDAFFLCVSALSVTGLTPVDVGKVLSPWGQVVLLVLIQLGGLGIVVLTIILTVAFQRRFSMSHMLMSQTAFNLDQPSAAPTFLARVLGFTMVVEILGAMVLYSALPKSMPNRLFVALFHAVSAFCNAGFSIFPQNLHGSPIQGMSLWILAALVMVGGLGFPVWFDMWSRWRFSDFRRWWWSLSLHTKMTLIISLGLWVVGALVFFSLEVFHPTSPISWKQLWIHSWFYSIMSRTAGFNLLPLEFFHTSVQFWIMVLMFIGAGAVSTGGGIKVSSLGVIFAGVRSSLKQQEDNRLFGRTIPVESFRTAVTVVFLYLSVVVVSLILLSFSENLPTHVILFEIVSALSTVGLSLGATAQLTPFGKLLIIGLMIFGRIGLMTLALAMMVKSRREPIRLPHEPVFVG